MGEILESENFQEMLRSLDVIKVPDNGQNRLENVCQFHFGLELIGYCRKKSKSSVVKNYEVLSRFSNFYIYGNC